ncbi:hypothetical protein Hdeb2414_s0037g00733491 [Helianthus debilis subsp. tardiflorus]
MEGEALIVAGDLLLLADGLLIGDLPLVKTPAPIPLAVYPAYDMLLGADADGDVHLFDDEPLEDDVQGEALLAAREILLLADAPAAELPAHSPVLDSFESVVAAPPHTQSAQHFSHGSDPDQASSVAPNPSFAFDHEDVEDSYPIIPSGFDPDQEINFITLDQPLEDPVDPFGPVDPIDHAFDFRCRSPRASSCSRPRIRA